MNISYSGFFATSAVPYFADDLYPPANWGSVNLPTHRTQELHIGRLISLRRVLLSRPPTLRRIGARVEDHEFVQIALKGDFLEGNHEVEETDALAVFRS